MTANRPQTITAGKATLTLSSGGGRLGYIDAKGSARSIMDDNAERLFVAIRDGSGPAIPTIVRTEGTEKATNLTPTVQY